MNDIQCFISNVYKAQVGHFKLPSDVDFTLIDVHVAIFEQCICIGFQSLDGTFSM